MWNAEIVNDPEHGYRLYLELLEDEAYRGRIELDESGQPILTVYPSETFVCIPANWLIKMFKGAQKDLTADDYRMRA